MIQRGTTFPGVYKVFEMERGLRSEFSSYPRKSGVISCAKCSVNVCLFSQSTTRTNI